MNKNFVKSPLNYTGGKYKVLPQIIPLFPKTSTFIDLFGGGGNVAANAKADTIIYNDINNRVVQILEAFKKNTVGDMLSYIDILIDRYGLSKDNTEGFFKIRTDYNTSIEKDPIMLYTIICYAFNNQIRFNSKGEYNLPFGKTEALLMILCEGGLSNFAQLFKAKIFYFLIMISESIAILSSIPTHLFIVILLILIRQLLITRRTVGLLMMK